MWLEVAAKPNMKVPRSAEQKDPRQCYSRSEANCAAVCEIFPFCHPRTHMHTKAPWHERMSSKRDCCCTREGPSCEVARRPRSSCGGASRPSEVQAVILSRTCENLLVVFLCGFHSPAWLWLGGKRSREKEPARATSNAQSTRHGARPGPKKMRLVYTRPPCVSCSREHEKRPAAGREELANP